ncbi:hypothetical protein ACFL02_05395 [Planctomycetota bacterium]
MLKQVRADMIKIGWTRGVVNKRIGMIKRMFKWAVAEQIVSPDIYQSLAALEGLKLGRSDTIEPEPVKPVPEIYVTRVYPYCSKTIGAMIKVQLLTAMRSTELCLIRPCDIDTTGKICLYRPQEHKTAYRGHERVVAIGPKDQKVLKPYL